MMMTIVKVPNDFSFSVHTFGYLEKHILKSTLVILQGHFFIILVWVKDIGKLGANKNSSSP